MTMRYIILIFLLIPKSAMAQLLPFPFPWPPAPAPAPAIAPKPENPFAKRKPILYLKKIKLSFVKNDPYSEMYLRRFRYDMKIKWVDWIPKTVQYKNATELGKWRAMKFAERMDRRISEIKVEYEVILDGSLLGYKIGGDRWKHFHKTQCPYPSFFVAFAEYHWQDYSWKEIMEDYEWCEANRFNWPCMYACHPDYPDYIPPAVAQKPEPSKLVDPSIYMLLGPPDPYIKE